MKRPSEDYWMNPLRLPPSLLLFCLTILILSLLSLLALLFLFLWITLSRAPSTTRKSSLGRSAAVVVLGDVGRSPRMCYHVQSLAEDGWRVSVLGYPGEDSDFSYSRCIIASRSKYSIFRSLLPCDRHASTTTAQTILSPTSSHCPTTFRDPLKAATDWRHFCSCRRSTQDSPSEHISFLGTSNKSETPP